MLFDEDDPDFVGISGVNGNGIVATAPTGATLSALRPASQAMAACVLNSLMMKGESNASCDYSGDNANKNTSSAPIKAGTAIDGFIGVVVVVIIALPPATTYRKSF